MDSLPLLETPTSTEHRVASFFLPPKPRNHVSDRSSGAPGVEAAEGVNASDRGIYGFPNMGISASWRFSFRQTHRHRTRSRLSQLGTPGYGPIGVLLCSFYGHSTSLGR